DPSDIRYHMAYRVTLHGRLDPAALGRAIDQVVERHESLRTRYVDVDGEPRQLVNPSRRQHIGLHDLSMLPADARRPELLRLEADIVGHPFDLGSGDLLRMRLVRLSDCEHSLTVVMHHIIGDGWSHAVLVRDICAFYRAEIGGRIDDRPASLPIQYGDYAVWQRQLTSTPECDEHVRYWIDELRGVSGPLRLPRDNPL